MNLHIQRLCASAQVNVLWIWGLRSKEDVDVALASFLFFKDLDVDFLDEPVTDRWFLGGVEVCFEELQMLFDDIQSVHNFWRIYYN